MSDQDFAAQVERLRSRQEEIEDSLLALADAIEGIVQQLRSSPTTGRISAIELDSIDDVARTIKGAHAPDRRR